MAVVLREESGSKFDADYRQLILAACQCGFWDACDLYHWDESGPVDLGPHLQWMRSQAVLRRFDVSDLGAPLDAVRRHLTNSSDDISRLHPQTLEHLVGDIFADAFNCKAVHVGGPGDNGIDLVLLDCDVPLAVQVKRHRPDRTVSVSIVREFIGALLLEGHMRGLVVTTADKFSSAARATAGRAVSQSLLDEVELVDGDALKQICLMTPPAMTPWRAHGPSLDEPRPPAWPRH